MVNDRFRRYQKTMPAEGRLRCVRAPLALSDSVGRFSAFWGYEASASFRGRTMKNRPTRISHAAATIAASVYEPRATIPPVPKAARIAPAIIVSCGRVTVTSSCPILPAVNRRDRNSTYGVIHPWEGAKYIIRVVEARTPSLESTDGPSTYRMDQRPIAT